MGTKVRSSSKIRYAFDEINRLVIDAPDALRPHQVLNGSVSLDVKNRLVYRVVSDPGAESGSGPHLITLEGTWTVTPDHQLALALHETDRIAKQTVYLRGALVDAQANALVFSLQGQHGDRAPATQRLTLVGRWVADGNNRLTFLAQTADGAEDRLTLQGGWEVGPRHELVYRYQQRPARRRKPDQHTLVFQGSWDVLPTGRLAYRLEGSSDSVFAFQASLQSRSLLASEGRMAYEVGMAVRQGVRQHRRIVLFGTWKVNRDLSVEFQIPYANGRIESIQFEGSYTVNRAGRVSVALRRPQGQRLGITLTLTKPLAKDAELFLQIQQDDNEHAVMGGVRLRF